MSTIRPDPMQRALEGGIGVKPEFGAIERHLKFGHLAQALPQCKVGGFACASAPTSGPNRTSMAECSPFGHLEMR